MYSFVTCPDVSCCVEGTFLCNVPGSLPSLIDEFGNKNLKYVALVFPFSPAQSKLPSACSLCPSVLKGPPGQSPTEEACLLPSTAGDLVDNPGGHLGDHFIFTPSWVDFISNKGVILTSSCLTLNFFVSESVHYLGREICPFLDPRRAQLP